MGDEASGGSDRLPPRLTGSCAGAAANSDENTSHAAAQPQNCSQPSVHSVQMNAMADRDRRSRVERSCSNIPGAQSRSSTQQHRRNGNDDQAGSSGAVLEARNRHRDRNIPNSGRHRLTAGGSANHRTSAEVEIMEDDADTDNCVDVVVNSDLTLLPILHADFVQVLPSSVSSADNWQACCIGITLFFGTGYCYASCNYSVLSISAVQCCHFLIGCDQFLLAHRYTVKIWLAAVPNYSSVYLRIYSITIGQLILIGLYCLEF